MMSFAHYESTFRQNIDDLKDFIDIYVSEIETKIKKTNYLNNIEKSEVNQWKQQV